MLLSLHVIKLQIQLNVDYWKNQSNKIWLYICSDFPVEIPELSTLKNAFDHLNLNDPTWLLLNGQLFYICTVAWGWFAVDGSQLSFSSILLPAIYRAKIMWSLIFSFHSRQSTNSFLGLWQFVLGNQQCVRLSLGLDLWTKQISLY